MPRAADTAVVEDGSMARSQFTPEELNFLKAHEVGRLATTDRRTLMPQVTPIIYAMDDGAIVVATDYGTKKLRNLKENPKAAIAVDDYDPNRAVLVQGQCAILERGEEYRRRLKVLFDRFETYRKHPWGEGESPILVLRPTSIVSWGTG